MQIVLLLLIVYFVGMFVIGYISSKRVKTAKDYLIGGSQFSILITSIAHQAAAMSGFMFLGFASLAVRNGAAAIWTAIASGTAPIITFLIFARKMSQYTQLCQARSFIDVLEKRYYDVDKKYIRIIASVIIFVCMSVYIGGQILGAGKTFQYVLGWDYRAAIVLSTVVVVLYTSAGGLFAVAWTDFVQGMLMIFGVAVGLFVALKEFSSFSGIMEALNSVDPEKASPFWMSPITIIGMLSAGGFAYCGQPHIVQMFMGMKNPEDDKKGLIIAGLTGCFLLFGGFFVMIAARVLSPDSPDGELNYLMMMQQYLPAVLVGLVCAAVLSAIMSSTDALLHAANTAMVNDFYNGVIRKGEATDKELIRMGRITALAIGVVAVLIAFFPFEGFIWIMWWAFGGLTVFAPIILLGLHWKRATREGAIAGMIIGFGVTIIWFALGLYTWIHLCLPALIVTSLVHIVVSLVTSEPPKEIQNDIESMQKKA